jgi:hypothetical protein
MVGRAEVNLATGVAMVMSVLWGVAGALTVGATDVGVTTGGTAATDEDPDLDGPPFSIQMPTPAAKARTPAPATTAKTGNPPFRVGSDPVCDPTDWEVAGVSAGASGMVISCKHKGQATRLPTYAVSQRIRCRHFGQTERNSLINVFDRFIPYSPGLV